MKQFDVTEANRTDRVAVIRARERQKSWLLAPTSSAGEFIGELERHFHRGGAVVAEENFREGKRGKRRRGDRILAPFPPFSRCRENGFRICDSNQFRRQQAGGFICQSQRRGVSDFPQLPLDGGVDFGMIMPVQIGPDGGIAVEIFTTAIITKQGASS